MRLVVIGSLIFLGYACWQRQPAVVDNPSAPTSVDRLASATDSSRQDEWIDLPVPDVAMGESDSEEAPAIEEVVVVDTFKVPESTGAGTVGRTAEPVSSVKSLVKLEAALARSLRVIESIPGYTATLEQQVYKGDRLLEPALIDMKLRRSPFSVYLKWQADQQEVLYVDGLHDGRLLAHPTRGITSFRPLWKLNPQSKQAMRDCRYPVTEIGIEKLTAMALNFYRSHNLQEPDFVCTESEGLANGRLARTFLVTFASDAISPEYGSSQLTFDEETGLLVSLENHAWGPDGRVRGLLERYRYHEFAPNYELDDTHFDYKNPDYHFSK
ncbi:DUF1571 domain-containing protein [Planctomicrobium sp. SH661]|uniref:DUF1571 domain-containing protein n=1 Tax=Planctomicrobium sp. SH661 TaxID=3448124 RepID=UPI003F5C4E39